jgi:hypothetical protein
MRTRICGTRGSVTTWSGSEHTHTDPSVLISTPGPSLSPLTYEPHTLLSWMSLILSGQVGSFGGGVVQSFSPTGFGQTHFCLSFSISVITQGLPPSVFRRLDYFILCHFPVSCTSHPPFSRTWTGCFHQKPLISPLRLSLRVSCCPPAGSLATSLGRLESSLPSYWVSSLDGRE